MVALSFEAKHFPPAPRTCRRLGSRQFPCRPPQPPERCRSAQRTGQQNQNQIRIDLQNTLLGAGWDQTALYVRTYEHVEVVCVCPLHGQNQREFGDRRSISRTELPGPLKTAGWLVVVTPHVKLFFQGSLITREENEKFRRRPARQILCRGNICTLVHGEQTWLYNMGFAKWAYLLRCCVWAICGASLLSAALRISL